MPGKIIYSVETKPYFYVIKDKITHMYYAGSRTAKGCNPLEFWKENGYTTSSKEINSLVEDYSLDRFSVIKIVQRNDAEDYETRFLQKVDAKNNINFYNQHNNAKGGFKNSTHISVIDQNGKTFRVFKTDERIGKTLFGVNKGASFSFESNKKKSPYKNVIIEGVDYGTISNACNILGLTSRKIKNYLKNGSFDRKAHIDYEKTGKKQSETKSSNEWKTRIGVEARKKQVENTDYQEVARKISSTITSPEWQATNTFKCAECGKNIIGKGNYTQHIRANKCTNINV